MNGLVVFHLLFLFTLNFKLAAGYDSRYPYAARGIRWGKTSPQVQNSPIWSTAAQAQHDLPQHYPLQPGAECPDDQKRRIARAWGVGLAMVFHATAGTKALITDEHFRNSLPWTNFIGDENYQVLQVDGQPDFKGTLKDFLVRMFENIRLNFMPHENPALEFPSYAEVVCYTHYWQPAKMQVSPRPKNKDLVMEDWCNTGAHAFVTYPFPEPRTKIPLLVICPLGLQFPDFHEAYTKVINAFTTNPNALEASTDIRNLKSLTDIIVHEWMHMKVINPQVAEDFAYGEWLCRRVARQASMYADLNFEDGKGFSGIFSPCNADGMKDYIKSMALDKSQDIFLTFGTDGINKNRKSTAQAEPRLRTAIERRLDDDDAPTTQDIYYGSYGVGFRASGNVREFPMHRVPHPHVYPSERRTSKRK